MQNIITIYTDGSSIGNGSPESDCGWACLLMYGEKGLSKSGYLKGKTNNYMEMYAVLQALKSITDCSIPCIVKSDSQYVIKTLNKEFRVGANEDLWNELFEEVSRFPLLEFQWVRGHDKDKYNLQVDKLAYGSALGGAIT